MAEYIMDCNREVPEPCESCDPCIELGCKYVHRITAKPCEKIIRCRDCTYSSGKAGVPGSGDMIVCNKHNLTVNPDSFCVWGVECSKVERKM